MYNWRGVNTLHHGLRKEFYLGSAPLIQWPSPHLLGPCVECWTLKGLKNFIDACRVLATCMAALRASIPCGVRAARGITSCPVVTKGDCGALGERLASSAVMLKTLLAAGLCMDLPCMTRCTLDPPNPKELSAAYPPLQGMVSFTTCKSLAASRTILVPPSVLLLPQALV